MTGYIIRRLALMVPTFIGITVLVSLVVRLLPGSVIDIMLGEQGYAEGDRERLERELGLDRPWPVQYWDWMWGVLRGDLGESLRTGRSIGGELKVRLPTTLELAGMALAMSLIMAIPVGIVSAARQDSPVDYLARSFAIGALALPGFWLATLVVVWPAIWWDWTPPIFYVDLWEKPLKNLAHMWLPALLLSLYVAGYTMRMIRSMMLEVLRQDYIRTAWAKGLRERAVVVRHALKNALIPVVTIIGLQIPILVGGAVVFEMIFVIPGVGRYLMDAVLRRDYTVLQGINLVMAGIVMVSNLVVDVMYSYLDPRVRVA
ncbi:MAG: ABC transporter permease [Dehalococcoidia bacterium]